MVKSTNHFLQCTSSYITIIRIKLIASINYTTYCGIINTVGRKGHVELQHAPDSLG